MANYFKRSLLSTLASAADAIGPEPVLPPGRFYMSINLINAIKYSVKQLYKVFLDYIRYGTGMSDYIEREAPIKSESNTQRHVIG